MDSSVPKSDSAQPYTSQAPISKPPMVNQTMRPVPTPRFPSPAVNLHLERVAHPGCAHFLRVCSDFADVMSSHHDTIMALLYGYESSASPPKVERILICLKSMPGVAHTHGAHNDAHGREIHVSAEYVDGKPASEIYGVLLHELVHVWQHNGHGTAPGGFIEGLADFVRMRGGLGAAHWHKSAPGKDDKWDSGYERTGYFLDWVDQRHPQSVAVVNSRLKEEKWDDEWPFREVGGLKQLWHGYKASFHEKDGPPIPPARPTHA